MDTPRTMVDIDVARESLSALVDAARAGETVVITRAGQPVAELRGARASKVCDPASIDWIEAELSSVRLPKIDAVALVRDMRDAD